MGSHTGTGSAAPLLWLGKVVLWLVILGFGTAVIAAVLVPRIGGATPYTILTGSMRPAMPPGTLVVVKPVPMEQIGIGAVVTYQLESGKPTVATHRVVSTGINGKGESVFRTKGDANDGVDAQPVLPAQVKGEVWYSVPYLGYAGAFLTGDQRHVATMTIGGGLALYSAAMFGGGLRGLARRSRVPSPAVATTSSNQPEREYAHG